VHYFNFYRNNWIKNIPDNILIEKVLLYLDIEEIKSLYFIFSKNEIRKVWKEQVLSQEPMYHGLNRLLAFLFFDIKDPDKYISDYVKNKKLSNGRTN